MPLVVPDCQKCGACCAYSKDWVEVRELDTQVPQELVEEPHKELWPKDAVKPPFVMRTSVVGRKSMPAVQEDENARGERCAALAGEVGKQVACTIYENRPNICRVFAPGSPECTWFLGWNGLGRPWGKDGF